MKTKSPLLRAIAENPNLKFFLLSILITGLSHGLYKGMLDNFLAEVVTMNEMDRGITEFFRELPGILLVLILAVPSSRKRWDICSGDHHR